MNYILEMNAFYEWLRTHRLSCSAISLWNALMHINNKANWRKEFSVSASTLQSLTGLSVRSVHRIRAELIAAGLVQYYPQGRQAALYSLVPIASLSEEEVEEFRPLAVSTPDTVYIDSLADIPSDKMSPEVALLDKPNQTKLSISLTHEMDEIPLSLARIKEEMQASPLYLEANCRKYRLSQEQLMGWMDQFFNELVCRDDLQKSPKDTKQHFSNWLHYQTQKHTTYAKTQPTHAAIGRDETAIQPWNPLSDASPSEFEAILDRLPIG